jgi:predicted AlkP superfamily pyrophosphatase or phosphodiesterase
MPPPPPASPARSGARRASTSDVKSYLLGVATAVLGVVIFTLAFFPNNIEMASPGSSSEEAKVEDGGRRDRVILMLVDALRTDFVWQDNSSFPFTMSRVSSGEAVAFTTRAHPPTVRAPSSASSHLHEGRIPLFLSAPSVHTMDHVLKTRK